MRNALPLIADAERLAFDYDDVSLAGYAWWAAAKGPAFVLLHGWGEDASTLAPVARLINAGGCHAISISMRGWAGSTGRDDYGLSAAKDIGRVLDSLRQRSTVTSTVLLGFSMGGLMAALAAAEQTKLAGAILISAPSHLPTVYRETAFGGVRRYFDETLQAHQWKDSSPLTHAHEIRCPVLVVTGGRDTMCPSEQGRRMAEALPDGELLHLPDMEHHPSMDEWNEILKRAQNHIGTATCSMRSPT